MLRGGVGLFYDRVNLNIPTFLDLPARTETRFAPSGSVTETWDYQHRLLGHIQNPRSLGWSLQLDREIIPDLFLTARVSTTQHHAKFFAQSRQKRGRRLSDTFQQWARSLSGVRSHRPLSFGREDSFDCVLMSVPQPLATSMISTPSSEMSRRPSFAPMSARCLLSTLPTGFCFGQRFRLPLSLRFLRCSTSIAAFLTPSSTSNWTMSAPATRRGDSRGSLQSIWRCSDKSGCPLPSVKAELVAGL